MSSDMKDLEKEFAELDDLDQLENLDRDMRARGLESLQIDEPVVQTRETLRILPISIAVVSLAMFGGVVWYAYSQGVTSGKTGDVPLLTPEHAAKVLPEDPGGLKVPHQDKLVYNQMEPEVDDSQVERLLPPPEQPIKPPAAKPVKEKPDSDTPPIPSITGPIEPKEKSSEPLLINPDGDKEETVVETVENVETVQLNEPEKVELPAITEETAPPAVLQPVDEIAPETTPVVPQPEPVTEKDNLEVASIAKIDKDKDWRVQIGAVSSHKTAVAEFQRLQKKNKDLLGKLALEVMKITSNGRDLFRIRIGPFENVEAAKKLCSGLKARGSNCITVKPGS